MGGIEIAKVVTMEPEKAPAAASAPESWGAHHGPEAEIINTSGCISCHKDMVQVPGKPIFSIQAKEDFDLDGLKEPFPLEDRSKGVHNNGTYTVQILYDSLQASDPRFDASRRPK